MPWLWEIYSDHKPSLWTALEVLDFKRGAKQKAGFVAEKIARRDVIRTEMSEILEAWEENQSEFGGVDCVGEARELAESVGRKLSQERTNWYLLYGNIRRAKLKGLRNRERIWGGVGRIVDEIKKLREEGKIVD